jgi:hypothetical protein
MTDNTLLLRQIHPNFVQNGRVTSQAFRPSPKDELQLSVDNGDMVSAEDAWRRFAAQPDSSSRGVMAIAHCECSTCGVPVTEDGVPYPEHCYLDFLSFGRKESDRMGKKLAALAHERGWLFENK